MKILKFYADWCKPCKVVSSIINSIEEPLPIPITEINIDEDDKDLTTKYKVRNVPTLVFINDVQEEVKRITSISTAKEFLTICNTLLQDEQNEGV
jgi:thioredoxin 1